MELSDSQQRVLGDGDFPAELDRLNWNAVMWGGLWALVHRVWPWFWGLTALRAAAFVFFIFFNRSALADSPRLVIAAALSSTLLSWLLRAILGFKANHLVWERRSWVSDKAPPTPIGVFITSERKFARIGMAIVVFGLTYGLFRDGSYSTLDQLTLIVVTLVLATIWAVDRWRGAGVARLTGASS